MENFEIGLMLMAVGMVTVFAILLIIINLSKLLIRVVNKVAPEEDVQHKRVDNNTTDVDQLTKEIILAAVAQVTGGKGKIASIERL